MRSHVTFRTPRFNQTEVHPHFINECCFGEDCIAWLIAELRARGWTDVTEPWQEDWGWQTSGERDGLLAPALHEVLRSAPDMRDVAWHFEDVFRRGMSIGAAEPAEPRSSSEAAT
jgi:hypothetical protein